MCKWEQKKVFLSSSGDVKAAPPQLNKTPHLIDTKEPISCLVKRSDRRNASRPLWLVTSLLCCSDRSWLMTDLPGGGGHTRGYTQCMTCWPCVWAGDVKFRVLWFGLHSRWRVKKRQYVWSEFWIPFAVVKETLVFLQVCPSTRTLKSFLVEFRES